MIVSAIANGGTLMKPYMIDHVENVGGQTVKKFLPSAYGTLMSANDAQFLTHLMSQVVEIGTGSAMRGASYTVAGKTGSAEFETGKETHSWFVGSLRQTSRRWRSVCWQKSPVPAVRSLRRSQDRCWIGILRNMGQ